jgi:WD40 repeat protein
MEPGEGACTPHPRRSGRSSSSVCQRGQFFSSRLAGVFSPAGRRFLTGSEDGTARLWGTATGEQVGPPLGHQGTVRSVAFSPDGQTLLTGAEDRTARLWRAETGQSLGPPLLHPHNVLAVAFGVEGRMILTGCQDDLARLWDAAKFRPLGRSFRHRGPVFGVALGRDGTVLTGSADGTARLWTVPQPLSVDGDRIAVGCRGAFRCQTGGIWDR